MLVSMEQQSLKIPGVWDAVNDKPYDAEHQRALEGLPHYWKLSWGWTDTIILSCGHAYLVRVEWLENDPSFNPTCHYKDLGGCDG